MAHEIIPIERIKREAHQAAKQHANANSANPYPAGSSAARVFKEQFFIARDMRALGVKA